MVLPLFILKITCFFILLSNILTDAGPIFWYCQQDWGIYTEGSTFKSNLTNLLFTLRSTSSFSDGFAPKTVAYGTDDQITGAAMCYADVNSTDCQNCLTTAFTEIVQQNVCGNKRTASVIYDACVLNYYDKNFSFLGAYWVPVCLQTNGSSGTYFMGSSSVQSLMNQLVTDVSYQMSHGYARGEMKYAANQTIYGLSQCTTLLPPDNCQECINGLINHGKTNYNNCSDYEGARIMSATCYLRYELSPFIITAPPPPPHVSPESPSATPPYVSPKSPPSSGEGFGPRV
ncbi:hypothetical protein LUZ60_002361 [Juncus effusus]|nr:hypothetical protein LUZ60_002361 [Juncus effusus]